MKNIKKISSVLVALMALTVVLNWEKIERLYSVITLFDQALIVDNFSHMEQTFDSEIIVKKGSIHHFSQAPKTLPSYFNYRGEQLVVEEFLKRRATTALLVIKNDEVTFENYYLGTKSTDKRISWSMAKSFVSVLFGMQLMQEKSILTKGSVFIYQK